jgi:hypothetical protein
MAATGNDIPAAARFPAIRSPAAIAVVIANRATGRLACKA